MTRAKKALTENRLLILDIVTSTVYCTNITDTAVVALAEHCPNLQKIDLCKCTNITEDAVQLLKKL